MASRKDHGHSHLDKCSRYCEKVSLHNSYYDRRKVSTNSIYPMCDNLGRRWRPPLRCERTCLHCMLQHGEWFGVLLSVPLIRPCTKQRNILSSMTTKLCLTDLPITESVALQSGPSSY